MSYSEWFLCRAGGRRFKTQSPSYVCASLFPLHNTSTTDPNAPLYIWFEDPSGYSQSFSKSYMGIPNLFCNFGNLPFSLGWMRSCSANLVELSLLSYPVLMVFMRSLLSFIQFRTTAWTISNLLLSWLHIRLLLEVDLLAVQIKGLLPSKVLDQIIIFLVCGCMNCSIR